MGSIPITRSNLALAVKVQCGGEEGLDPEAEAQLIKYLDGKRELKGGWKEDRIAAREWISMFLKEVVVSER